MREGDAGISTRIREVRLNQFGEEGIARVAGALKIPRRTWENFERGVKIHASILLQFIELTDVEPRWLLTGEGERYRSRSENAAHRSLP